VKRFLAFLVVVGILGVFGYRALTNWTIDVNPASIAKSMTSEEASEACLALSGGTEGGYQVCMDGIYLAKQGIQNPIIPDLTKPANWASFKPGYTLDMRQKWLDGFTASGIPQIGGCLFDIIASSVDIDRFWEIRTAMNQGTDLFSIREFSTAYNDCVNGTLYSLQNTSGSSKQCPAVEGEAERVDSFNGPMENCIDPSKSYTAIFDTTEGEIVVELDTTNTPGTVNNFVSLARYRYYDTTTIFRTDPSIDIIQGGGFSASDSVGYTIADEGSGFEYSEGDLVMARSQGPNSGGAQFFFVTGPNGSLLNSQGTYVTFGKITQGLDVVKAIQALHNPTDDGLGGKPSRTVTVNSVTITEK
jgi:cyclophilin family peptidyl-prolyl cis-trans isomerase